MASKLRMDAIIMGGGRGARLYPLTMNRAKPAVGIGGKYRLIDIPLSNCINSGINNIHILTQVNTASLHRHIFQTYKFDMFSPGNIEILAAQQTLKAANWFQGTADAVRSYWDRFSKLPASHFLILAGDHLYSMNYREFYRTHLESEAEVTIAVIPIPVAIASRFGVLQCDDQGVVEKFVEKPDDPAIIKELSVSCESGDCVLGSMGIYIFRKDVLQKALSFTGNDFGKNIIPACLEQFKTTVYRFEGYWEDIGTIGSFFEANINLTDDDPAFSFFDVINPIFTRPRFLPGSRITGATVISSIINEGCQIGKAKINKSILGTRSIVQDNVDLDQVYMLGADIYENRSNDPDDIPLGIGAGSVLKRVILDKNVRIGQNVKLINSDRVEHSENDFCCIRDGIIVIPKNTVIPAGTVI
ncbi:MAG: glucose-1-phosphate adenylyltransferase [Candidatus Marinimicrobia bacterium]|nr:glucose-1-phosphate adenylyltransferase [Candidatus Neomarinimicrobiota bacterium]